MSNLKAFNDLVTELETEGGKIDRMALAVYMLQELANKSDSDLVAEVFEAGREYQESKWDEREARNELNRNRGMEKAA